MTCSWRWARCWAAWCSRRTGHPVDHRPHRADLRRAQRADSGHRRYGRELGGSPVTLLSVDSILSALPDPPTGLLNAIHSIETIRNYVNTIEDVASAAAGGWINIGSFQIAGKSSPSLLTEVAATLGISTIPDWSNLVSVSGDGVNYDGIKQEIRSLLGDTIGGEVDALFDQVTGGGDGGGMQFTYPIVTDPSSVAMGCCWARMRRWSRSRTIWISRSTNRSRFRSSPASTSTSRPRQTCT